MFGARYDRGWTRMMVYVLGSAGAASVSARRFEWLAVVYPSHTVER